MRRLLTGKERQLGDLVSANKKHQENHADYEARTERQIPVQSLKVANAGLVNDLKRMMKDKEGLELSVEKLRVNLMKAKAKRRVWRKILRSWSLMLSNK